jgi:hypothetical protein
VGDGGGFQPPADPTQPQSYFPTASIGAGLRSPLKPPGLLHDLIYPARLHSITGPPEAGKTVVGCYLLLEAMQRGHAVLFIDEEAGYEQTTRIFAALGADPELLDKYLTYLPFPSVRLNDRDLGELFAVVQDRRPRLALLDSSAAMMTAAGINENHADEVTSFWKQLLYPFALAYHCAVLLTDHDSRTSDSRYARGSTAKLASTDVGFKLWPVRAFSRQQDGLLRLAIVKDRPGFLHRHWLVRVTREPLSLSFARSTASEQAEESLSPVAGMLLDQITDTPQGTPELIRKVTQKYGHPIAQAKALEALTDLVTTGLVERMDLGAKYGVLWARPGSTLPDA